MRQLLNTSTESCEKKAVSRRLRLTLFLDAVWIGWRRENRMWKNRSASPRSSKSTHFIEGVESAYTKKYLHFFWIYPVTVLGWVVGIFSSFDLEVVWGFVGGAAGIYIATSVGLLLVLLFRSRKERKRLEGRLSYTADNRDILATILAKIYRKDASYYTHEKWVDTLTTGENGDTRIERDLTITAGPRGTEAIFLSLYGNHPVREEGDVSFSASCVVEDGATTPVKSTEWWESDPSTHVVQFRAKSRKHTVFVFPKRPLVAGETYRIRATWEWRGYFKDVMCGEDEDHILKLSRPCREFECIIRVKKTGQFENGRLHVMTYPSGSKADSELINRDCDAEVSDEGKFWQVVLRVRDGKAGECLGARLGLASTPSDVTS